MTSLKYYIFLSVFGSIVAFIGATVGTLYGMVFPALGYPIVEFGGLAYEGNSILAAMQGAALASMLFILVAIKKSPMRKKIFALYVGTWLLAVVVQHFYVSIYRVSSWLLLVLPVIVAVIPITNRAAAVSENTHATN